MLSYVHGPSICPLSEPVVLRGREVGKDPMETIWEDALSDPAALDLTHAEAEVVDWGARRALRLNGGLALIPGLGRTDATVEVLVGTDGPAYPGIAFRLTDVANYELAYAVPHASGLWDALQYDPVWHGSNTWQLYHGPSYQQAAEVPTGRWYRLRLTYCGARAALWVDDGRPLAVSQLSHPTARGLLGLWTYRPAHFAELRVSTCSTLDLPPAPPPPAASESVSAGTVDAWFVEGYGVVAAPGGRLVLNHYLPATMGQARLMRRFEAREEGEVRLRFGYSDALSLTLDGREVYAGECTFSGFDDRSARGYAELGHVEVRETVTPGTHTLVAALRVSEPFGWGLVLAASESGSEEAGLRWLPAGFG